MRNFLAVHPGRRDSVHPGQPGLSPARLRGSSRRPRSGQMGAGDQELWTAAAHIKHIKSLPPNIEQQLAKPESPKQGT